jgi:hypothetical protein
VHGAEVHPGLAVCKRAAPGINKADKQGDDTEDIVKLVLGDSSRQLSVRESLVINDFRVLAMVPVIAYGGYLSASGEAVIVAERLDYSGNGEFVAALVTEGLGSDQWVQGHYFPHGVSSQDRARAYADAWLKATALANIPDMRGTDRLVQELRDKINR